MKKELCTQKTYFKKFSNSYATHPTCVYFDRAKQCCELPYCYRAIKEKKGAKA